MLQSFVFWLVICFTLLPFVAYPLSWGYLFIRGLWISISRSLDDPEEAWYYASMPVEDSEQAIEKIKQEDGYQALYWFTLPIRTCIAIVTILYSHMKEK